MNAKNSPFSAAGFSRLVAAVVLLVGPALGATAESKVSVLSGQVSNAATGSFLEGANVVLEGTERSTFTDREGRFRFVGVTAGATALLVSFAGLDARRIPVIVGADSRTVQDVALTSRAYLMEKFTVAGELEGTAKSESLQRLAPNVKNIISADTFGNRADANIANLLENVAGMAAIYNDLEARQVSIRGIDGNMNSVSMDGQQLASSAVGTGRNFFFDQHGLGNVESIEVTKAATPDMEGASVGGGINLVTKSAFDRAGGRTFSYSLGLTRQDGFTAYAPSWKEPVRRGYGTFVNLSYQDVLGKKRNLGLSLTSTVSHAPTSFARSVLTYGFNNPNPAPTPVTGLTRQPWAPNRTKILTGLKLDFRPSESTLVSLGLTYNYSHALGNAPAAALSAPASFAIINAAGNRTGGGQISPLSNESFTRVFPAANTRMALNNNVNATFAQTLVIQPMVRHRFDGRDIDYGLSYSESMDRKDSGSRPNGNATMGLANIGWTFDRSRDPSWPTVVQTAGPSMYDLNNYTDLQIDQPARADSTRVFNAKFDLRQDLRLPWRSFFKTGASYQRESRRLGQEFHRYRYVGPDGIQGSADDNRELGQFGRASDSRYGDSEYRRYLADAGGLITFPDAYAVARHRLTHPGMWIEDLPFGIQNTLLRNRQIVETITAAYLMGNVRAGRFSLLGGVRVEGTRDEGEGPLDYISPEERARRAAWMGAVTVGESVRRATAQYSGRQTNRGQYTSVLPSVHLKYEPIDRLTTRLSWSSGLGRPAFGSIIPLDTVNDDTQRVTSNNPNLRPQYVDSFDLMAEYYIRPQGLISAGLFRKDIHDFIFTNTYLIGSGTDNGFAGEYAGYTLTTQSNRGSAKVEGVEFSYRQQLTFLPGWARGFGVDATYTALRTEGNYGGNTALSASSLQGFVPKTGAFGLTYRGFNLELRLQAVFSDEYLLASNANPVLQQFKRSRSQWNWKSKYNVSRKLSLFLDVDNFTAEPAAEIYRGFKDRPNQYGTFQPKIQLGVGGRF